MYPGEDPCPEARPGLTVHAAKIRIDVWDFAKLRPPLRNAVVSGLKKSYRNTRLYLY